MKRLLWIIPQQVGLWLILISLYAHLAGERWYGLAFGVLAIALLALSMKVFDEVAKKPPRNLPF